jgi:hypothetical protein
MKFERKSSTFRSMMAVLCTVLVVPGDNPGGCTRPLRIAIARGTRAEKMIVACLSNPPFCRCTADFGFKHRLGPRSRLGVGEAEQRLPYSGFNCERSSNHEYSSILCKA